MTQRLNHSARAREPRWPSEESETPRASREGLPGLSLIWTVSLAPAIVLLVAGLAEVALSVFCVTAASCVLLRVQVERARSRFVRATLASALRDELTGLAGRRVFIEELRVALDQRIEGGRFTALFYIDLDSFKSINDTLGHSAGDEVLISVASRLAQVVHKPHLLARMGGDELAVLCPEIEGRTAVLALAEAIIQQFSKPIAVASEKVWANASVGIVMASSPRPKSDDLLVMADTALYQAKSQGKGRYVLFEPNLPTPVTRSPSLDADLRDALLKEQFVLHFQPIVNLNDLSLDGFEALIRWQHPKLGMLGPAHFIPLAEETGLISALGDWIIQRSFSQIAIWRSMHDERLTLNINLSPLQFRQRDLLTHIWRNCSHFGVPPGRIVLEITESFFLQNDDVTEMNIDGLNEMGFGVAIDDFGVGYSSLSYLGRYKIDVLKVDRSFLGDPADTRHTALMDGIIRLGHSLGIPLVAEGIENKDQLKLLQELGCDLGQGYFLSVPLSEADVVEGLASGALLHFGEEDAGEESAGEIRSGFGRRPDASADPKYRAA
jgi:diguanylate cyclase (GGDEF)-like protein